MLQSSYMLLILKEFVLLVLQKVGYDEDYIFKILNKYKAKLAIALACLNQQGVAESTTNDTVCLLGGVIKMERRYFNLIMAILSSCD